MEKQHCELQKYHYEAVRDSLEYRMIGQTIVMLEQVSLEMPRVPIEAEEMEQEQNHTTRLNREQIGSLQQIHGEVFHLRNKLNEHLDRSKKKKGYEQYK